MSNLLWDGVNLMVIGMGAVFAFLVLLVVATGVMSSLVARYFPEPETPSTPSPVGQQPARVNDEQLMAVIAAAIQRHRSRHK